MCFHFPRARLGWKAGSLLLSTIESASSHHYDRDHRLSFSDPQICYFSSRKTRKSLTPWKCVAGGMEDCFCSENVYPRPRPAIDRCRAGTTTGSRARGSACYHALPGPPCSRVVLHRHFHPLAVPAHPGGAGIDDCSENRGATPPCPEELSGSLTKEGRPHYISHQRVASTLSPNFHASWRRSRRGGLVWAVVSSVTPVADTDVLH